MAVKPTNRTQTARGCVNESGAAADYCVKQGPEWLAGLLVDPPMITYVVAGVVVLGVIGLTVLAHRRDPLDRDDAREMLASIVIVGGCGLGAWTFKELAIAGYIVDVLGGWAVGGGVGMLAARQIREADDPQGEDSDHEVTS